MKGFWWVDEKKIRLRLDSHHAPKKSVSCKDLNTKGKTLKLKGKKVEVIFWLQGRERLPHADTKCELYVKETFVNICWSKDIAKKVKREGQTGSTVENLQRICNFLECVKKTLKISKKKTFQEKNQQNMYFPKEGKLNDQF